MKPTLLQAVLVKRIEAQRAAGAPKLHHRTT